jgi:hypothetical protein
LQYFARIYFLQGYLAYQPFHIAYLFYQVGKGMVQFLRQYEMAYQVQPLLYPVHIKQGEYHPPFHQPGTHWCMCVVYSLKQVCALLITAVYQFQVAYGESVHPHKVGGHYSLQGIDVLQVGVFGILQIMYGHAAGYSCRFQVFHAKAFQRLCLKVLQQQVVAILFAKHPFVKLESIDLRVKLFPEIFDL